MRLSFHTGLFLLFSATLLVTGCSKDKDDTTTTSSGGGLVIDNGGGGGGGDNPGGQNAVQLLCDKNYKLTAATISPAYMGSTNYYGLLPSCATDDIYRFSQNGSMTVDEGPGKCDPNDPQVTNGTWAFSQNNTVLSLTLGGETSTFNVITLDGTTLKMSWQEQDPQSGQVYTITGTWTKQ